MSVLISEVRGNGQMLDGGAMFGNAPRAVWEKWIAPDELGRIPLACRAMLIEIEDKKILCETGIGAFFAPKLADRYGVQDSDRHVLLENLAALGVTQEQIDYVILSHLHFDHAGGLLPSYKDMEAGARGLCFPNAQYVVGVEAWERAQNPHPRDQASFIPALTDRLKESKRMIFIEGENVPELYPERISFFESNGHTPGQMHTLVKGDRHTLCFAGDLIPGSQWVHTPITMGYDRYPELLIDEKTDLYEQALHEGQWVFFFTHDNEIAMAEIAKNDNGRMVPIHPKSNVQRMEL